MSVEINGEKYFTKEMTKVHTVEVIQCPDCEFEFAAKHEIGDNRGLYRCPNCTEASLHHENNKLRGVLEDISKMDAVGFNKEYVVKRYSEYAKNALNGVYE